MTTPPHPAHQHSSISLYPLRRFYGLCFRCVNFHFDRVSFFLKELLLPKPSYHLIDYPTGHFSSSEHLPRIFILAAGDGTRWTGPTLKQLVPIDGQPLLTHTFSQLPSPALVITKHKQLFTYPYAIPSNCRWICQTLLSTKPHWGQTNIILLGDTYYSHPDLHTILSCPADFAVFGSVDQGEIFALKFNELQTSSVARHLRHAIHHTHFGGRGKLWEFYRSYLGVPLHQHSIGPNFIELPGSTDFDTIDQYHNFIHNHSRVKHEPQIPVKLISSPHHHLGFKLNSV